MPLGAEQHKSNKQDGFLEICCVFATIADETLPSPLTPLWGGREEVCLVVVS
jgi:hypothetical protein